MKLIFQKFSLIIILISSLEALSLHIQNQSSEEQDSQNNFLIKGWLKYLTYAPNFYKNNTQKPSRFEKNQAYDEQFNNPKLNQILMDEKDQFGFLRIPSKLHFFFILTPKTLFVLNSRENDIAKLTRSLEINWIQPIDDNQITRQSPYNGGLEDIGNFREGFCFRIKSLTQVIWDMCADEIQQKSEWMLQLSKIIQHSFNQQSTQQGFAPIKFPQNFNYNPSPTNQIQEPDKKKIDGRWIKIHDWSQCTLVCGGGKQYYQRLCIPPQNGGKDCDGNSVLERDCNNQPCPGFSEKEQVELPSQIQINRISTRPQRYEACIIKEGDLDIKMILPEVANYARIPIRAILNNQTFSIFTTPNYETIYRSYDLKYLSVKTQFNENSCFKINDRRDIKKFDSLCVMSQVSYNNQSPKKQRDEWVDSIILFQKDCQEKTKYIEIDDPSIQRQKNQLELEKQQKVIDQLEEEEADQKEISGNYQVQKSAKNAVDKIEKELKFEQMILKEETEKEKNEEKELDKQLQIEEEKEQCLEKSLQKKERDSTFSDPSMQSSQKVQEIDKESDEQLSTFRKNLQERLQKMRKISERRKKFKQERIRAIRTLMAQKIYNENKAGNIQNCNPHKSPESQSQYCNEQFKYREQIKFDCLSSAYEFCACCCENEFGRFHQNERAECYKNCDSETYNPQQNQGSTNSHWTFVKDSQKVQKTNFEQNEQKMNTLQI